MTTTALTSQKIIDDVAEALATQPDLRVRVLSDRPADWATLAAQHNQDGMFSRVQVSEPTTDAQALDALHTVSTAMHLRRLGITTVNLPLAFVFDGPCLDRLSEDALTEFTLELQDLDARGASVRCFLWTRDRL